MPISPDLLPPLPTLRLLIRANHILHQHSLVDAFGHISIRHPLFPNLYITSTYDPGAPALISSAAHFTIYRIPDSQPFEKNQPQGYSERFIHGEVLRRFPRAMCVVHSHAEDVIACVAAGVPVRPVFHMAGFLGAEEVRVFDAGHYYKNIQNNGKEAGNIVQDMLVKSIPLGSALADCLSEERPVVLQRKHGFTCFGDSIEQAVYRAVYTQTNCRLLKDALCLAGGNVRKVTFLEEREVRGCKVMNEKTQDKAFRLWLREVQRNALYETDEGEPDDPVVSGMEI